MKKALKITGITLLSLLILLITIPFVFQGKIQNAIKDLINENINAKVEFSDVSLSFIKDFPQAHISISNLVITNYKPFEGETLVSSKNIAFSVSLKELIKSEGDGPISINTITLDETLISIISDKNGNANYDIAKESDDKNNKDSEESNSKPFALNLKDYKINKGAFSYVDQASNIEFHIKDLFHQGHGVFSAGTSELDTKTEALITFSMDSTNYINNTLIKLDALIDLDLEASKYTFKNNKGFINQLPIEFNGFIQLIEEGQNIDITFENPESDFKNFLALMPKEYSKDIENVKTTGDFKIKAIIKGQVTEETIPTFDVSILSNNAAFKYPDLPKQVKDITINTQIKNTTGIVEDTYIDIKTLNFNIDEDVFKSSALLKNITTNPHVTANFNGTINLSKLKQVYPIELEQDLIGILKANINTAFDMDAIETNAYERIKNSGSLSLTDYIYNSEELANPMHLTKTDISFNNGDISLNEFKAKTGSSDLKANGTIKNLLGFVLSDNTLKGDFSLESNLFKLSDFMVEETPTPSEKISSTEKKAQSEETTAENVEPFKIPAFLDCKINAKANTVVYDNLTLKNVKGNLLIKDQRVVLENLTSNIFDGKLSVSGNVSTKQEKPTFNFNLDAEQFDIVKSFKNLELFQTLVPVAGLLEGKLSSLIKFSGELDNELLPNLTTISGDLAAELFEAKVRNNNQSELINKLESNLNFIDFNKLNLDKIKTQLAFEGGKVIVSPLELNYQDIDINISGSHSFEKQLDYNAILNVPAKYLGSDVNRLIDEINAPETNNMTVPITANIGGQFNNPSVKTDLTSSVKNLTKQLVKVGKQKAIDKGKEEVKNVIGNIIKNNTTKSDSSKTNQSAPVKEVLDNIISGNKDKNKDTKSETNKSTENTVKDALGGLLGGKKK